MKQSHFSTYLYPPILPKSFLAKWLFLVIIYLYLPVSSVGQCPDDGILKINRLSDDIIVPPCSEILRDTTCQLTFETIHQNPQKYVFTPLRGNPDLQQPLGATYWLRFKIRNEDSVPVFRYLGIYKKEIERIQLFMQDEEDRIDTFQILGSVIPFSRKLYTSTSPLFAVNFAPLKTYTLYIYLDYRDMPLSTGIIIAPTINHIQVPEIHKAGFFVGLTLAYACIALIMFAFNRKPLYFSYFIYTLGGTAYKASTSNIGYEFIWSNWQIFASISDDFAGGMLLSGFLWMTILFFDTPQYFPILDKIIKGAISITLIVMLIGLFRKILPLGTYYNMTYVWLLATIFVLPVVLITIIKSYLKFRRREALLFLLGFSSLLTTIICVVLVEFGLSSFRNIAHNIMPNFTVFFEFTILLIVLIYRLKDEWTSKKIKELELQQTLSEQRQRISRDLHDDVGSTLNSISVFSEIAKQQVQALHPEATPLLERIGESSRELVMIIDDIVWAINPQNDKFENITLRMRLFAADLLMPKDVDIDFQVDERLNSINLTVEERKQLYLIFKEAVNNVYKYAACSTLKIQLDLSDNMLCMTIVDNGKGFDKNNHKNGNGLPSMLERAKILRGALDIQSVLGGGTSITLLSPIIEKDKYQTT